MRHRKLQELIGAYADGELRAADRSRVEEHLKDCPECRRDLAFLRKIDSLPRTSPAVPQEADYWVSFAGRVRAGIAREQTGAPASRVAEVKMFQDSFYHPERRTRVRAAVLPLSLVAHAAVLLLLIILPLMNTDGRGLQRLPGAASAASPSAAAAGQAEGRDDEPPHQAGPGPGPDRTRPPRGPRRDP
jgi:anti-sigma factor RsiW